MIYTLHQLKKFNSDLKTNYLQLTLHGFVLILNLIPVVLYCLPDAWFTLRQWSIIDIIFIGTDTMS